MINLVNISKSFKDKTIFEDLNLQINDGEAIGIIAPNGFGKTVLLDILTNKIHPDKGQVQENDMKKESVFYSTQRDAFPEFWTIKDLVNFYLRVYGEKLNDTKFDKYLRRYSLLEYKNKFVTKLSGGQQRKVLMIVTNLVEPKVLIMDEPTAGVDSRSTHYFREDLARLNANGTTIILTSHNFEDITEICNRIVFIKDWTIKLECEELELTRLNSKYDTLYQEEI